MAVIKIFHATDLEYTFTEEAYPMVSDEVDIFGQICDQKERTDCYIG